MLAAVLWDAFVIKLKYLSLAFISVPITLYLMAFAP